MRRAALLLSTAAILACGAADTVYLMGVRMGYHIVAVCARTLLQSWRTSHVRVIGF